jgi:DNA recombination protein RmuC
MNVEIVTTALVLLLCVLCLAMFVWLRRSLATSKTPTGDLINLEVDLKLVGERLQEVQNKIEASRLEVSSSSSKVVAELESVMRGQTELQRQGVELDKKTGIIATSLKGSGAAGDWGELQLRRVLEFSGMTEHVTFSEQMTFETEDSEIKPDVLVHLDGNRDIIIDAKAPKIDFTEDPEAASKQAAALTTHIDQLAQRKYPKHVTTSLDFVILFVPTEGILATALSEKPDLIDYAASEKILLASPMTLLAILKAVEYGWRQVEQKRNEKTIFDSVLELCDQLARFTGTWNTAARGLQTAVTNFNAASSYFDNTLREQYESIRRLGINPTELEQSTEVKPPVRELKKWET